MIDFLQRFSEISEKYPERAAIVDHDGERTTSYASLNDYSSRVASYLKTIGIQKEELVAIRLEKSMEYMTTELGVMKCGCAYVPLSDSMGEERIEYVLKDSSAKFVFDVAHWDKAMKCQPLPETDWADSDEHDLAFIIYTSGSTGKPKGVIEEYGAYRFITTGTGEQVLLPYCKNDYPVRFANVAPVAFSAFNIISMSVFYEASINYYVSDALVKNPVLYMQFVKKHKIEAMFLTASLVKSISADDSLSLKVVYLSSERVSDAFSDKFDVRNLYCNTELMSTATHFVIDKSYPNTPIGAGCSYTDLILLDNDAVSEKEGEICLRLPFFRGYLHKQEETEKAFVTVNGKKFFHTGDIARRGEDGLLYVLGRINEMVKINGNRVEPAEVESALKKVLETKIVAVKAFEKNGRYYLCSYYEKDISVSEEKIREALKPLIPAYMIPSYFVRFEKMPLNQNGKIDKANLTPPEFSEKHSPYIAPETELQKILCAAFKKVLEDIDDVEKIGIDDDFILLGGDSVSAMELMVQCKDLPLTVPLVLKKKTVRKIAEALEGKGVQKKHDGQTTVLQTECDLPFPQKLPLTQSQKYIFSYQNSHPLSVSWNVRYRLYFDLSIDAEKLCNAYKTVLKAHPAFYTVVEKSDDGAFVQYQNNEIIDAIKTESLSEKDIEEIARNFVQPFTLDGKPLFRTRLIKTEKQLHLFLDVHHGLIDGFSIKMFFDEVEAVYNGKNVCNDGYCKFISEELAYEKSEAYKKDIAYFNAMYDGTQFSFFPTPDFEKESVYKKMETEIPAIEKITQFCYSHLISKNDFFIAALSLALSLYNECDNVGFTWTWSGRQQTAEMQVAGLLTRDLPVALKLSKKMQLMDLLKSCTKQVALGIEHGRCSYGMTDEDKNGPEVCFLYQGCIYDFIKKDADYEEIDVPYHDSYEFLEIELLDDSESATVLYEYDGGKYKEESMERFAALFLKACYSLLQTEARPEMTIGDIN